MTSGIISKFYSVWGYRLVRIAVSMVFIISGASKISNPQSFAVIIDAFGILPQGLSLTVAIGLIALELVAGVALLMDTRGGLSLLTALLVTFMAILVYGIYMGLDVDCGCFGPSDPEAEAFHGLRSALYRDFVILGGVLYLYIWRKAARSNSKSFTEAISNLRKRGNK